ncbi:hypothetical protein IG611_04060 [Pectobacterium sp. A535-S3-A17]|uniref:hypothetical protein n=1 Tax=Pectobacterium quasiaquaticum TaxID=2774015 RepID=UPI001873C93B|nr:hypothetical protein [Pectobacterium quasiaquaticum]MBE5215129.1 hypothetical protein [Pectobacterium quasiaquaticum]MBE5224557.1 hypothetical protein [Pectobacterium quasiaquaticum]
MVFVSDDATLIFIRDIFPDCLVKGGDYEVEQIAGYQEIQMAGELLNLLIFSISAI